MIALLNTPIVDNPLRAGMRMERTPDPCIIVIFGITGDLAHRKLLPALYNLSVERRLPGGFSVIGFARRDWSDEELRKQARDSIEKFSRNKPSQRPAVWDSFAQGLFYVASNFDDPDGYKRLANKLEEVNKKRGTMGNHLYYLSTPPDYYPHIITYLGAAGLANKQSNLIAIPATSSAGATGGNAGPAPGGSQPASGNGAGATTNGAGGSAGATGGSVATAADATGNATRGVNQPQGDTATATLAGRSAAAPGITAAPGSFTLDDNDQSWRRIVVEKPFGHDLPSAQQLNKQISQVFDEDQTYRIDHYLGKETVQNILVFRFANGIWEPIWNRRYVDHIQITVAESLGVEERASYYDTSGALRDMLQNHMMQLVTLVAMDPPSAFDAQAVRDEKAKVLRAIKPFATPLDVAHNTIRGQYGPGAIFGKPVPGYRQEEGVPPNSETETYVAGRFFVDNWRWSGVPFYLRHGKRLPKRDTEIAIQFKPAPLALFQHTSADELQPNLLVLHIQPDEGISIKFESKMPGQAIRLRSVDMNFRYGTSFGIEPADAYERLLMDAMLGDSTLFTRRDEVELMWQLATSILEGWQHIPPPTFPNYRAGSWGPAAADDFIARDGRTWRRV